MSVERWLVQQVKSHGSGHVNLQTEMSVKGERFYICY